ncbi:hypothetical protein J7M28_10850 [bacterium]|nr:hypothetical protein [bacterium]
MTADKKAKAVEESPEKVQPEHEDAGASDSLDSVRNILFGAQQRDAERRFARLEKKVKKDISDLKEEIGKRMGSLETHFRGEVESLSSLLKADQERLEEHANASTQRLSDIEKTAAKHSELVSNSLREIRQQILDQSKTLRDEIFEKCEKISATLDREAKDLQDAKVDRSMLGTLLAEMGMRLCEDNTDEQNES